MTRVGALLVIGLVPGAASRPPLLALRQTAASTEQTSRARALISGERPLTTADIEVVQAGIRSALAGKYAVERVEGPSRGAEPASESRDHEYLLDGQGRILFHRYAVRDTARPGTMNTTILEFTDIPAIRCADRSPYPGRRLGITYTEYGNAWHIGNPMVVDEKGMPWAMGSPGYDMLHAAPTDVRDAGARETRGRSTRGLSLPRPNVELVVWIDVQSLLPIVETRIMTPGGVRHEISTLWTYPPARAIGRPQGITPPDCA